MKDNEGAADGEQLSVSSPIRILSFKKDKRKNVAFPDGDTAGFGVSGDYGPNPSEVYGFVGSITTIVATAIFLVWAYVSETWLHAIGDPLLSSRYWALALPTYVIVTVFLAMIFYIGLNFLSTPPPTSLNALFDEFSREPSSFDPGLGEDEIPIEPISDIGIDEINRQMFGELSLIPALCIEETSIINLEGLSEDHANS